MGHQTCSYGLSELRGYTPDSSSGSKLSFAQCENLLFRPHRTCGTDALMYKLRLHKGKEMLEIVASTGRMALTRGRTHVQGELFVREISPGFD